ncbi:unnamed protein product, partial [Rotaria sp. Silwood2]
TENNDQDLRQVLFEIDTSPHQTCLQTFADITHLSDFSIEQEVLMMLCSIFRLEAIVGKFNKQIWFI